MLSFDDFSFKAAGWRFYEQLDESRRWQGNVMDSLGWGPRETPSREVRPAPGVSLKAYAGEGPALLLVPAPIKQAYIWDLAPGASVVARALERGVRPYVVQWDPPPRTGPAPGLADYAERLLLACADAVQADTGQRRVFLAGHSLGGTLSAIFAALHPDRVAGLAAVASPLHFDFGSEAGALGPIFSAVSMAGMAAHGAAHLPGSFLSAMSYMACPEVFGTERVADWMESLPDGDAMSTHMRVERWSLDEMALSAPLVCDVLDRLYRDDALLRGTLAFNGREAGPGAVAAPLFTVADRRCRIVPPAAILPFHEGAASRAKRLFWYEGDTGVAIQHVGMLVGRNAHVKLWPELLEWVLERAR